MPCRCDGYEPSQDHAKKEEERHLMLCQAQSLAHKLGFILEREKVEIPAALKKTLEKHRAILQVHKEAELQKDREEVRHHINNVESKIKQIKGLGGVPTDKTIRELEEAKSELVDIDSELLLGRKLLGEL